MRETESPAQVELRRRVVVAQIWLISQYLILCRLVSISRYLANIHGRRFLHNTFIYSLKEFNVK